MRGRGSRKSRCPLRNRITPACAGKRPPPTGRESPGQDHPRMCGEERRIIGDAYYTAGSPPHVRGRVADQLTSRELSGITPARAGKRRKFSGPSVDTLDRVFPRVRGRVADQLTSRELLGSPPARAGKRDSSDKRKGNTTDHPRACGEESPQPAALHRVQGSPPRVRGRVLAQLLVAPLQRITPARAGKRGSSGASQSAAQDHPRVCGEESIHFGGRNSVPRITPAYAGKS